jgi:hypothetical protein
VAAGTQVTDETGIAPIPPLNFNLLELPWAAAGPAIAEMSKAPAATATNILTQHRFTIFM